VESRGEIIAFTDDDCVVDPGWLDGLGETFADPLVMAVTGYVGPVELEHTAQCIFEDRGGFFCGPEPWVRDPAGTPPIAAAGAGVTANAFFRREAFGLVGMFAEDMGPGTPASGGGEDLYALYRVMHAGYRLAYDPARIVWHRHRRDWPGLRRQLKGFGVGTVTFVTRCLVQHRDAEAIRWILNWWIWHVCHRSWRAVRRRDAVSLALTASELAGAVRGPWSLLRSVWARRGLAPIELGGDGGLGGAAVNGHPSRAVSMQHAMQIARSPGPKM
jgi:hypothetical protein